VRVAAVARALRRLEQALLAHQLNDVGVHA
jgi:hypothetical protein